MLMSGKEYLQSIRDGRTLYVGRELSTPEQKCIGWPEQKYISDLARRPPNWGPFRQASSLRGIIRRVIGAGRV
jgi:hypothetical protein